MEFTDENKAYILEKLCKSHEREKVMAGRFKKISKSFPSLLVPSD